MKNNRENNTLIFVLIIVLLVTIIGYLLLSKANKYDPNEDEDIKNIYNTFLLEEIQNCSGLLNYSDKKISNKDIDIQEKLCVAFNKITLKEEKIETYKVNKKNSEICTNDNMTFRVDEKKCQAKVYDTKELYNELTRLFGENDYEFNSFNPTGTEICYKKDDKLYCGLSETYKYTISPELNIYRIITKVEKSSDNIIIYDNFIKTQNNECYVNYTTPKVNEKCKNIYKKDNDITSEVIIKYGTKYKHIFKNDNDNYYWVSSEPIKE